LRSSSESVRACASRRSGRRSNRTRHPLAADRPRRALLAGAVALAVALVVGILVIQFLVDQPYTHAAVRLVAAAVLVVAVSRIRTVVSALVERPSAWEEHASEARWTPSPHSHFEHFHDEVRFGVRSRPTSTMCSGPASAPSRVREPSRLRRWNDRRDAGSAVIPRSTRSGRSSPPWSVAGDDRPGHPAERRDSRRPRARDRREGGRARAHPGRDPRERPHPIEDYRVSRRR
jgi:hypothetical protein